jgi:pectin methylesterase-like acyl-CoA thioesterase
MMIVVVDFDRFQHECLIHLWFLGCVWRWQDTVYTGKQRAYLFGCRVNGTTDFNYGQGAAVYDECVLVGERAGNFYNGQSFLTATTGNVTGSTPENPAVRSAYLVRNSQLPASPRIGRTYLGRPWGDGATVIYDNVW